MKTEQVQTEKNWGRAIVLIVLILVTLATFL